MKNSLTEELGEERYIISQGLTAEGASQWGECDIHSEPELQQLQETKPTWRQKWAIP